MKIKKKNRPEERKVIYSHTHIHTHTCTYIYIYIYIYICTNIYIER